VQNAKWFDKLTILGSTPLTTLSLSKGSEVEGLRKSLPQNGSSTFLIFHF
jgi:hypothetical protein